MADKPPKVVLFIHHGSASGGAAVSLITLIKKLDRTRYVPLIACDFSHAGIKRYFEQADARVIGIDLHLFVHTSSTWKWYTPKGFAKCLLFIIRGYWKTRKALFETIKSEAPAFVHLNGLTLLPYSKYIRSLNCPVIQHVREPLNSGVFGFRKKILQLFARNFPSHTIYISRENRNPFRDLKGGSTVLYNPVDLKPATKEKNEIRKSLGIGQDDFTIFFPGGSVFVEKGIIPFLLSLSIIKQKTAKLRAIIPGIDLDPHPKDKVRRKIDEVIQKNNLSSVIMRLPFSTNVTEYYVACDLVAVPFVVPHFSRGAIEAGFMAKPVVASRIDVMKEVVEDRQNGLLALPDDASDLAEKIKMIMDDPILGEKLGEVGFRRSTKEYDAKKYSAVVMSIYDELFIENNSISMFSDTNR